MMDRTSEKVTYCEMFGHILNPHLSACNVLLEGEGEKGGQGGGRERGARGGRGGRGEERGREGVRGGGLALFTGPFRRGEALGTRLEKDGTDKGKAEGGILASFPGTLGEDRPREGRRGQ